MSTPHQGTHTIDGNVGAATMTMTCGCGTTAGVAAPGGRRCRIVVASGAATGGCGRRCGVARVHAAVVPGGRVDVRAAAGGAVAQRAVVRRGRTTVRCGGSVNPATYGRREEKKLTWRYLGWIGRRPTPPLNRGI